MTGKPKTSTTLAVIVRELHAPPLDAELFADNLESTFPTVFRGTPAHAGMRLAEFFAAHIRNPNTRAAYLQAVCQFLEWAEAKRLALKDLNPFRIAAYVENLPKRASLPIERHRRSRKGKAYSVTVNRTKLSKPSIKQHLAAVRMLFDWLVVGQVMPMNPASSVRGPKYVTKRGKTPVLSSDDARRLLDSIPLTRRIKTENGERVVPDLVGLRDRALIGTMVYSFARVSAVCGMRVDDYYLNGKRGWIRLNEKGGKHHEVPAHHNAENYIDAYLKAAGIGLEAGTPLFRSFRGRSGEITELGVTRTDVFRMVKRRAKAAGLSATTCCHTFRATGITAYLSNGGTIEKAQQIAAHESPRTTKLYDRTKDEISLDEVERILI